MNNFSADERVIGLVLLDMLIYYSNEQEESLISNLIRLLKRDIWLNENMAKEEISSCEINSKFIEIYKKMCFVPVDESDVSASSFCLTSQFKKSKEMSDDVSYIKLTDVPLMIAMKMKYYVFYDDIVGSGNQFYKFWKKKQFGDNRISLKELAESNPDRSFYYLVLGGYQDGIDKLKEWIPDLKIIVSESFPISADIFKDENEYWELNPEKKEVVLNYIRDKEKEWGLKNSFGRNLPVLFQHGRASNTAVSLYWKSDDPNWNELYKR